MLAKDRRFTMAAVMALGLGIGVNNSVFTIINMALFRELPFPDADRLVDPACMDTAAAARCRLRRYLATGRRPRSRSKASARHECRR